MKLSNEQITQAAIEAGLLPMHSCCNTLHKFCHTDVWNGNLQSFAHAIECAALENAAASIKKYFNPGDELDAAYVVELIRSSKK